MTTWVIRLDEPRAPVAGPRVAVKDAIDIAGLPTSAGCRAVADRAEPAEADAACLAGTRAAVGATIAGKTNLHELCFGTTGVNPWLGTPVNTRLPGRVPGGSSSGSAAAVAAGEADVGIGTDTGGSVRIPAACCGIVGLKTTWGRVPLDGVWPLAPALDTVGPLARTVAEAATGLSLLDPGFGGPSRPAAAVGRLRVPGVDPEIDAAIDGALAASELEVHDIELPGWDATTAPFLVLLLFGAWRADGHLIGSPGVSPDIAARVLAGRDITDDQVATAGLERAAWCRELATLFARAEVIALPTLDRFPPEVADAADAHLNRLTSPWNLSGSPAISLPVPARGPLPASLQLAGPDLSEDVLC
ncbi:MAG TPA: amidase, partial [Acidimicrobiales bacterium]